VDDLLTINRTIKVLELIVSTSPQHFADFSHALVLEQMNKTPGVAINRLKKLFP
jgi:hypothetical protein